MAQRQRIRPTQQRAVRMRRDLLDATVQLLEEVGSERLTTSAIVEHAHVSSGTFYRYFDDKAGILEVLRQEAVTEIAADLMAGVARALDQDLREAVREVVATLTDALERHAPVILAMVDAVPSGTQSNVMPEIEAGLVNLARVIPMRHLPGVSPERLEALVFVTMGVTQASCLRIALQRPPGSSREELIDIATDMLTAGLRGTA